MLIDDALEEIDYSISVKSSYMNFNGDIVPRVTDILSKTIHSDALMVWSNHLGFKHLDYKKELAKAADYGSEAHQAIESYLASKVTCDNISFKAFVLWYESLIENHVVEILGSEETLVCKYFGGTYDLLLRIDGRIYLVDFKTSNMITSKYFMQLAAYRYMIYNIKNINIDGCVILQLCKTAEDFNEYTLDFSVDDHYQFIEACSQCFLSLVYAYYNTRHVEEMYKSIF